MTKSQYPYPPDEFDVRGPEGAPVGVHREPRSGWSSVWPFLLVAVVFAGLAVGIVSYLSNDDGDTTNPPVASEQSAQPDGETSEEPAEGESAEGEEGSTDETSEEPAEEETEEAASMPGDASAANLAARVVVYNDGAGDGQAGAGQSLLTGAGFSDVGVANADDTLAGVYSDSTVLYGADRADTATAVAEALGVDAANVQESDDVTSHPTDAVWVILKQPVG
ncbi:LytR cell envelope-related transcriptional attenuator [Isoptericola jiangsuensis]|uniref:LytR cell envelope-related transcriptional attenuator n=1 Tax=Isoptericola jiangsuensis TaxID=548579 RepID=A0A2A9F1F2_9MICO|nr:LytR C-terminal domain-containing protein [Isoptericola jiangsuensis]PFG44362.1 LytR cell envelope-related transcriptional attenuator [Isoptericola jiangsuensis]